MNDLKRLKRLVDVRRRLRDVKRGELVEANTQLERAKSEMVQARQALAQSVETLSSGGCFEAGALANHAAHADAMARVVDRAAERMQEHERERDECRQEVAAAHRDLRVLELLRDRREEERTKMAARADQGLADEVAGRAVHMGNAR